jgi:hypothetical protein
VLYRCTLSKQSQCTLCCVVPDALGDSRAVLIRGGKGFELTQDHRPSTSTAKGKAEMARVEATGSWSVQGRVCGILAGGFHRSLTTSTTATTKHSQLGRYLISSHLFEHEHSP